MLVNYEIGEEYRYIQKSSSKGTQAKYQKDGYWYKINRTGYEAQAEYLVSVLLEYSNITEYVIYERCKINGRMGCRSRDFLEDGEEFLTFQNLYSIYEGGSMANKVASLRDVNERKDYVIQFIAECTGTDCSSYLSAVLGLDMLILNEDRHFHNLGLIRNADGYRTAPVFDNGYSLLCDYSRYPGYLEREEWQEMLSGVAALPLSGSFEQQALAVGLDLQLDYNGLLPRLKMEDDSRAKEVLLYQLKRYKKELFIR